MEIKDKEYKEYKEVQDYIIKAVAEIFNKVKVEERNEDNKKKLLKRLNGLRTENKLSVLLA